MERPSGDQALFFVGAGISIQSGFPAAFGLVDRLLQLIAPDQRSLRRLRDLWPKTEGRQRARGDYLRFELLLEIIQELVDPDLALLSFIPQIRCPNDVHHLLAARGMRGDILVTTNFDSLLEEAILSQGGQPVTVCRNEDFARRPARSAGATVPVFKLHGSFLEHQGSESREALESIQATLTALSRGVPKLSLPQAKLEFLTTVLESTDAVFAGYSGTDDLDIMPALLGMRPQAIHWIDHDDSPHPEEVTRHVLRRIHQAPGLKKTNLDRFFEKLGKASALRIERGRTACILERDYSLGSQGSDSGTTIDPYRGLDAHLEGWARDRLRDPAVKHALAADIFFRLSHFHSSDHHLRAAWQLLEPEDPLARFVARVLSKTEIRFSQPAAGRRWAQRAVDLLPSEASREERIRSWHQLGFSAYRAADAETALATYEKCLHWAEAEGADRWIGVLLHDTALILQDRGELREAIRHYEASLEASTRAGDLTHVAWSLFQLGTSHFDLGEFDRARSFFKESDELAETLGDVNHLSFTQHELGMLDLAAGDLVAAAKRFRRCLQIDRSTGQSEFSSETHLQLGVAFLEAEKLDAAERRFQRALAALEERGDDEYRAEALAHLAHLKMLRGLRKEAEEEARASLRAAKSSKVPASQARAEMTLGWVLTQQGRTVRGGRLMGQALERAYNTRLWAVLLDLMILVVRHQLEPKTDLDLEALRRECSLRYEQLGNHLRSAALSGQAGAGPNVGRHGSNRPSREPTSR